MDCYLLLNFITYIKKILSKPFAVGNLISSSLQGITAKSSYIRAACTNDFCFSITTANRKTKITILFISGADQYRYVFQPHNFILEVSREWIHTFYRPSLTDMLVNCKQICECIYRL